jgi:hypothetical protein
MDLTNNIIKFINRRAFAGIFSPLQEFRCSGMGSLIDSGLVLHAHSVDYSQRETGNGEILN